MPVPSPDANAADEELRALLIRRKNAIGATYEQLAESAKMSRSSVNNYLRKPGHRRDTKTLEVLLATLGATPDDRKRALQLHKLTLPGGVDPAEVGWLARARAAECTVWAMAGFTATEATVHTAIGRRHTYPQGQQHADEVAPPEYVPRDHDVALRRDLAAAAAGDLRALLVVRGTSSTGKTRSLFEAVKELCPGWTVIRPRNAAALRRLPQSGIFDQRCVVWLNELQGFLAADGQGLSLDILRDLYASAATPVVLVGTLWPEKLRAATDSRDERTSDTRNLLMEQTPWVRWHEVPPTLTTETERAAARELAVADPRLAQALADPDRFGFAQTLAGARELLEHYLTAPQTARLLLEAAADARRLGHGHALTGSLLRGLTLALWRENRGLISPPPDWYDTAVDYASRPLRADEGVRALIPIDDTNNEPGGYGLADYLEQYLTRTRRARPVPDAVWDALRGDTSRADDLSALARVAGRYARFAHAEALHRKASAGGDPDALLELAEWLSGRPGRETDAEAVYRAASAGGDSRALRGTAERLAYRPGREADAEAAYREAAAAGDPGALEVLARWLDGRPGREADAEAAYREAAAAGDPWALRALAGWLDGRPGREADVEAAYRAAAAAGDPWALRKLAGWLAYRPGREADAEAVYREAAVAGDPGALEVLAGWLDGRPGREADVEAVYREAVAAGDPWALRELAGWLFGRPGREADAEAVYREAVAAGDPQALRELTGWLSGRPGREADVEAVYRAAAGGDPGALRALAGWLSGRPGREADAEAVYREAVAAGDPQALRELTGWLSGRPGREADVEAVYRAAAGGDPGALRALVEWLDGRPGREADAEAVYREAVAAGDPWALRELVEWLVNRPGREADAEAVYREAVAAGDRGALRAFAGWLDGRPGREADAEAVYREAVAAGDPQALPGLAEWLRGRQGREADAVRIICFGVDAYGRSVEPDPAVPSHRS